MPRLHAVFVVVSRSLHLDKCVSLF